MTRKKSQDRRCSYVVTLSTTTTSDDLQDLSRYLSNLCVSDCDVVILDPSPRFLFDQNRRVLRWVGRHIPIGTEYRHSSGEPDIVRAAAAHAACEKVLVAGVDVRYTSEAIDELCEQLELHEVVEPQDYLQPLPWWGAIEAGRMLVHRGIEPSPDHGATYGFRRSAIRGLRGLSATMGDDHVRRLAAHGAEVHAAYETFVQRRPPTLDEWMAQRPRQAGDDFSIPAKTIFFFALAPMLLLLGMLGGAKLAASYGAVIAIGTLVLALRGRNGATAVFPLRAAFFAPLWVFERSVSVYWALFRKLTGATAEASVAVAAQQTDGTKVASGE
ncbi:MAG TPA: hypothetical protein VF618_05625 [Thermoanaerobaculia bacterium]